MTYICLDETIKTNFIVVHISFRTKKNWKRDHFAKYWISRDRIKKFFSDWNYWIVYFNFSHALSKKVGLSGLRILNWRTEGIWRNVNFSSFLIRILICNKVQPQKIYKNLGTKKLSCWSMNLIPSTGSQLFVQWNISASLRWGSTLAAKGNLCESENYKS